MGVDPTPRLTCRTTPEIQRNVIPAWWTERHEAWKRQEAGSSPTKWCYDCSVGAAMIRNGCSGGNSTPAPGPFAWKETTGIKWCSGGGDFHPNLNSSGVFGAGTSDGTETGCPLLPKAWPDAERVASCQRVCEKAVSCVGFTYYNSTTSCCFRTGSVATKPSAPQSSVRCYEITAGRPVPPPVSCAVGEAQFAGLRYGIEPLLEEHQVDMYFTGHIHMYERSLPVMRSQIEQSYVNPKGVVHINTGNSGGRNGFENGPPANFTGMRLTDVPCYTRIKIRNATHLGFEQAHAGNGSVLDSFELSKLRG